MKTDPKPLSPLSLQRVHECLARASAQLPAKTVRNGPPIARLNAEIAADYIKAALRIIEADLKGR